MQCYAAQAYDALVRLTYQIGLWVIHNWFKFTSLECYVPAGWEKSLTYSRVRLMFHWLRRGE